MGKTVSTEFAALAPGKTRNPHNPDHTPGGSSSGSAAAVASGMVPLAMGTQTSGSLIRPGSFCGIVAYKPTRGTIDKTGVKALADSLDTVGVMAREVRDAAFFASALSGRPDLPDGNPAAPRIGFYMTPNWDMTQPETRDAMERARRAAEKSGAGVVDVAPPPAFADLIHAHDVVMDREMLHALAFERLARADRISRKTRDYLGPKTMPTPDAYDEAQRKTTAARDRLGALFQSCDVLLTPAAVGEAPEGRLDTTGDPTFNRVWTLLGVPCVTVPARPGGALPVGVQIVGRLGADLQVLAAAAFVEAALRA
jgi:amidase